MQQPLIFLDTETTGLHTTAALVQLAYKIYGSGETVNELFKPREPIGYEAMAVHHITEEMVKDKPAFAGSETHRKLREMIERGAIIVAHNAKYDLGILKNEGITVGPYICTQKVAHHLIESENYQLQYLRYSVLQNRGMENIGQAHDALADILVLEQLFNHLLSFSPTLNDEVIAGMVDISAKPLLLKKMTFGKYKGMAFSMLANIDRGYMEWMRNKPDLMEDENLKYTVDHYLSFNQ